MALRMPAAAGRGPHSDWYRDAIIYELHVRAYADSDDDGIGDFRGLVSKLDYLQDLGVTAIWLLPFYPSPLRDDGYDIAKYQAIHPSYGTLRDFRAFLREARRQGLRVITELVLNHTSDQHPWFQRARRSLPGTVERDFYVWSDTPDRYRDARIIFKDFESSNWSWDPVAKSYYWHRFYSHQPDLNFDNPAVLKATFAAVDFWLGMGVDGLRLDAIPYLYEREGTNCENLPETYEYLQKLRAHIDERFGDRMLLAEANQWPEDAAAYFGDGNRCHMAFHFPLMPRMFMSLRLEDRFPIVDILQQTPAIPDTCQWAIFLRNHDELTLEMVTDEERDYMYRVYAEDPQARINLGIRRRLGPLLGNDRRVIEAMNALLLSLPGTPVVYYGDEIGMGDNIYLGDRNGVRTPMQWSADRNAGFSRANPQRLFLPVITDPEYHYESLNVEAQQNNPNSLLWWTKRIIALRKRYLAFGRGTLEFLYPENRKVLVFLREYENERILVVVNLSRHAQYVEIDLSRFRGFQPVELFGRTEFPPIGELPYLLTLGPHAFYWFAIEPQKAARAIGPVQGDEVPILELAGGFEDLFTDHGLPVLEEALPRYVQAARWFRSKARRIRAAEVVDAIPVPLGAEAESHSVSTAGSPVIALVRVEYTEGDPETYVVPLAGALTEGDGGEPYGAPVVARLKTDGGEVVVFDAVADRGFAAALFYGIARRRTWNGEVGRIAAFTTPAFRRLRGSSREWLEPTLMQAEQTNSSIVYGDRLVLKLLRRLEDGINPDLEVGRFLTESGAFPYTPPVAGALEYERGRSEPATVATLHGFVHNEGDAWSYTLDSLQSYLERARARQSEDFEPPVPRPIRMFELAGAEPPPLAHEMLGAYLESARLLGQRTAELHIALGSNPDDPAFAPEAFSTLYQRALYQSMRTMCQQAYRLIRSASGSVPQLVQISDLEDEILARYRRLLDSRIDAKRIRVHGDYHLGQVLYTGKDFVVIDFEGEPSRPLGERRIKRTPLHDVAGMLRSFHYAAYTALAGEMHGRLHHENPSVLEPWVLFWYAWVSAAFLQSYLEWAAEGGFLPASARQTELLLDSIMMDKAMYELRYELNNRPSWVTIPIKGILQQLESPA